MDCYKTRRGLLPACTLLTHTTINSAQGRLQQSSLIDPLQQKDPHGKTKHCLHVDGAVEDAGPLVGVEGRVVVVPNVANSTQVIADDESHRGTQSVEHRLAAGRQGAGLDGIRLNRRLLHARRKVLVWRVPHVTVVPAYVFVYVCVSECE